MIRFSFALPSSLPFYRVLGWIFLLIPTLWNVWLVEAFLDPNADLTNSTKVWIWISDVLLIALGLLVIRFERTAVINVALITLSLMTALGLFELVLRIGLLDNVSNPHPVWVPAKFKEARRDISKATYEFIQHTPFGFKDIQRSRNKPEGYSRIAVMGDSFIQGWIMHYDEIWSHRLEKRIQEHFNNIEVLSWGKSGWSTLDEFRFLKEHGIHYGIDLLIVGYVINDTDLGNIPIQHLVWHRTKPIMLIRLLFPNVIDYCVAYINLLISRYVLTDYGYETWISKIYSENNLKEYGKLLKEFSEYCVSKHIRLLFVFTPNDYDPSNRDLFEKVIPLVTNADIEYLDLYPAVYDRLHTYPQRQLWVTLADAHPGPVVTEVYADEVFQFLNDNDMLDQLARTGTSREDNIANATVLH